MRTFLLALLVLEASAIRSHTQNPVTDTMEGIGNTAGTVQGGVSSAGSTVGADKVGEGAGGLVTGAGGAVGGAASSVGGSVMPEQVGVLGGGGVNAVSTAVKCVMNLTIQYMLIYTAIAILRVVADFKGQSLSDWTVGEALENAVCTVAYAPMLAILCLAARMRVIFLTQGKGNPPIWMQSWMLAASYSVLALTLVAMVVPLLSGEKVKMNENGDIDEEASPFKSTIGAVAFTVLKYAIMIGLYIGTVCIIYGTYTYVPPAGSWPGSTIPPPAPAVACTMILSSMYFLVYAFINFAKTFQSFSGVDSSKLTGALNGAICTMFFAPMMAVLFIGIRLRAMQMDPINVPVPKWAQNCFHACTYAVMMQCILAICVPLILGGSVKKGTKGEGDVEYEVNNKALGTCFLVARWIIMISVYFGISASIWSVFAMEHPKGKQYTPPVSPTMQCVINLTVQFFIIFIVIWVIQTVKELTGFAGMHIIENTMENAKGTIAFCPMLSILFVATRMRAMTLTNWKGAPQGWTQDGMYMATWSILIQFLMVLLVPVATFFMEGKASQAELDEDGNVKWEPKGKIALICVQVIRWLGFVLLYAGVITVMVGIWTMTKETANGRGSVPLVGNTPFGGQPMGPNDVPGVPSMF